MKILIIGASGLLGKAVTEELKNYEIDFDLLVKYPSFYDGNALLGCAYDEDNHILLLVKFDESSGEILNCIAYIKECDE